ncbi:ribulose phosphate epimerase [Mycobacterium sp. NPDC003449]
MIASWHRGYPGQLAGSVYAAPAGTRPELAGALADNGLGVHVDVMAAGEGLPAGVSLAELRDIAGRIDRSRLEVHLIGSADFVDHTLAEVLAVRPARVYLPWDAFGDRRAEMIRAAGADAWIAVWQEWPEWRDGQAPPWPAVPDGALVMLIEPGSSERYRAERLDVAASCAVWTPVIVDGGITEDIAPHCIAAGVHAMVVGRALLADAGTNERKPT